ncbi:hypothetical protein [Ferroplasma sp.]|uniref:hypothetical protein n=1 Tax=Ferroplasma sp. TaxID=2591003 RepID=UPI00307F550A
MNIKNAPSIPVNKKNINHIIISAIARIKLLPRLILYIELYAYKRIKSVKRNEIRLPKAASGANMKWRTNAINMIIIAVIIVAAMAFPKLAVLLLTTTIDAKYMGNDSSIIAMITPIMANNRNIAQYAKISY